MRVCLLVESLYNENRIDIWSVSDADEMNCLSLKQDERRRTDDRMIVDIKNK